MEEDEGADLRDEVLGQRELAEDAPRHVGAHLGMPVEVAAAVIVLAPAGRLADVVKERRPPQRLRRHAPAVLLDARADAGRVLEDIVRVIGGPLVEARHGDEVRQGARHHLELVAERPGHVARAHDAVELDSHALAGDVVEPRRAGHERLLRGGLDREAQAAGKAHRPERPQGVLAKAAAGVTDSADESPREVFSPAVRVEKPALGMPGHGVDREVPACQVLADVGHEADLVGMAEVGVGPLHAVGRDLDGLVSDHGRHGAVRHARLVDLDPRGAEHALGLLPGGRRGHVDVVSGRAEKGVSHPAAHDPGLVSSGLEK